MTRFILSLVQVQAHAYTYRDTKDTKKKYYRCRYEGERERGGMCLYARTLSSDARSELSRHTHALALST